MNEYTKHFQELWMKTGGLITPAIAAKILDVTTGRISQMQDEGKLKVYKDKTDKTMLSILEVNRLLIEKNKSEPKTKKFIITYELKDKTERKEITVNHETTPEIEEIIAIIQNDLGKEGIKITDDDSLTMSVTQDFEELLKDKVTISELKKGSKLSIT